MNEQRRVLLVENSTGVGGSTIGLFRLATKLREGPYQPLALFYRDNSYVRKFTESGVETALLNANHRGDSRHPALRAGQHLSGILSLTRGYSRVISRDIPEALRIRDLIKKKDVHLVHVNGRFNSCRGAVLASGMAQVPCLCHVRDFYSFDTLDRWFARRVDLFVYMSRALQHHTERLLPWAKGRLVYDGIDPAEFRRAVDPAGRRASRAFDRGDVLVGNVGRLVEWKGQHIFLEALSLIADGFPGIRALVVGDTDPPTDSSYLDRLRRLAKDLGIENKVSFTGFVEDVPRLLASLDLLVHSSTTPEPFGLTILEGMAAGLPVVATAAGGALDMVEDGKTGRLVTPGDAYSMGEALRQIISNGKEAARMGEAAQRRVSQHFTVEQYAKGVEQAYSSLLQ